MRRFAVVALLLAVLACAHRDPWQIVGQAAAQQSAAIAEWDRLADAILSGPPAAAESSLGRDIQCSGPLVGTQPPFLLVRHYETGILCLANASELAGGVLDPPGADVTIVSVRGKVQAVFPSNRLIVLRANQVDLVAGQ